MENEISKRYEHTHDIESFKTRTEFKDSDYCFPNLYYKFYLKDINLTLFLIKDYKKQLTYI